MKRILYSLISVSLILVVLLAGCSNTPAEKVQAALSETTISSSVAAASPSGMPPSPPSGATPGQPAKETPNPGAASLKVAEITPLATIDLPEPAVTGEMSLEEALATRRSVRSYASTPLNLSDLSQLLWAAQGITDQSSGKRTAPSAMASYPLLVYVVVKNVANLDPGIYLYQPQGHQLLQVAEENPVSAAYRDMGSAVDILMGANYAVLTDKVGEDNVKFVYLEGGHAAENLVLEATALGLGAVTTASFQEDQIKSVLGLGEKEGIFYVIPVGNLQ